MALPRTAWKEEKCIIRIQGAGTLEKKNIIQIYRIFYSL